MEVSTMLGIMLALLSVLSLAVAVGFCAIFGQLDRIEEKIE